MSCKSLIEQDVKQKIDTEPVMDVAEERIVIWESMRFSDSRSSCKG